MQKIVFKAVFVCDDKIDGTMWDYLKGDNCEGDRAPFKNYATSEYKGKTNIFGETQVEHVMIHSLEYEGLYAKIVLETFVFHEKEVFTPTFSNHVGEADVVIFPYKNVEQEFYKIWAPIMTGLNPDGTKKIACFSYINKLCIERIEKWALHAQDSAPVSLYYTMCNGSLFERIANKMSERLFSN